MQLDIEITEEKLERFFLLCASARSHRNDITLSQLQAFLRIALADTKGQPMNGSDVKQYMGMTSSQAYRIVWNLGSDRVRDRGATRQMGLLTEQPDPAHRNSKLLVLTDKGKNLFHALVNSL